MELKYSSELFTTSTTFLVANPPCGVEILLARGRRLLASPVANPPCGVEIAVSYE